MTGSNTEVPLCRAKNIMNKKHYNYLLDVIIINPKQNDAHQILYWKHNDLGVKMCLNRRKVEIILLGMLKMVDIVLTVIKQVDARKNRDETLLKL